MTDKPAPKPEKGERPRRQPTPKEIVARALALCEEHGAREVLVIAAFERRDGALISTRYKCEMQNPAILNQQLDGCVLGSSVAGRNQRDFWQETGGGGQEIEQDEDEEGAA